MGPGFPGIGSPYCQRARPSRAHVISYTPGSDVTIATADVVLMRSEPLDVPATLLIGCGTLRTMRQNLGWAIGYR
jgi:cation transport ATPase